jgi:hypothetical protein
MKATCKQKSLFAARPETEECSQDAAVSRTDRDSHFISAGQFVGLVEVLCAPSFPPREQPLSLLHGVKPSLVEIWLIYTLLHAEADEQGYARPTIEQLCSWSRLPRDVVEAALIILADDDCCATEAFGPSGARSYRVAAFDDEGVLVAVPKDLLRNPALLPETKRAVIAPCFAARSYADTPRTGARACRFRTLVTWTSTRPLSSSPNRPSIERGDD